MTGNVALCKVSCHSCFAGATDNAGLSEGIAPLLVARSEALLAMLCEHDQPGLLDALVTKKGSKARLLQVCN